MGFTLSELWMLLGCLLMIGLVMYDFLEWTTLMTIGSNISMNSSPSDITISTTSRLDEWESKNPVIKQEIIVEETNQFPIDIATRRVTVIEISEPGVRPCIAGGPLKGSYHLNSIVFNWGLSDDNGSKHSINRTQFPLEMQLIHLKSEHESLEDAILSKNRESVAVVSFLFEPTDNDNNTLDPIIANLSRVTNTNTKVYVPPFYLDTLFPLFESKFYSYNGSLTQPPYSEIVTWIIQSKLLFVSSLQVIVISNFYKLFSHHTLSLIQMCVPDDPISQSSIIHSNNL
ncbi:Similar to PTPRG: Receptor-type tyrosine-protein phosphatase gamma (Gallus gallus) [Cotesia congregata]|uniref:carbonic anhydrase n=1 Tax=Cotesia congregata TaxID=51543 RepID=A0A8J2MEN7_COTCN|nr:Similar to PTPRG: Receptor-type tyrosine-protein phosphatase gamma (Gallus gallus) [Cotesia congregata]